ncbi:MAG: discoidin domain-containing protein [Armatimonadetes bacterium]|nr:discoidin domain-containing protein [Armatimonadota bacterium]
MRASLTSTGKRIALALLGLGFLARPALAADSPAAQTSRLAIFPLRCTDTDLGLGRSIFLRLYDEMLLYPEFAVVERARLQDLLQEQRIGESGLVDSDTAARLGKLLGASHALLGEVLTTAGSCKLALRLAEVETGRVLMTAEKPVPQVEDADEIAGQALKDLMEGGPVYRASSVRDPQSKAACAFDSNQATSWVAAEGNTAGWLEVWYKRPRTFREVSFFVKAGPTGEGVPKRFSVSYWTGQEWKTLSSVMGNTRAEWQTRFAPVSSPRWRLEVTAVIGSAGPVTVTELVLK